MADRQLSIQKTKKIRQPGSALSEHGTKWDQNEAKPLFMSKDGEINEQLRMTDFNEGDIQVLHDMLQMITRRIDWIVTSFYQSILDIPKLEAIIHKVKDEQKLLQMVRTTTKLLNLEQQIVLEAYEKEHIREKEEHYEIVKNELKSKITGFSEELEDLSLSTNAS